MDIADSLKGHTSLLLLMIIGALPVMMLISEQILLRDMDFTLLLPKQDLILAQNIRESMRLLMLWKGLT